MKVVKVNDASCFENVHLVDARKIFDSKQVQVIHMALKPGQSLEKHTISVDVFFYILEGEGIVEVGDETQKVEKDMLIDSPKGLVHLLRNTGLEVFRFLVVKLV